MANTSVFDERLKAVHVRAWQAAEQLRMPAVMPHEVLPLLKPMNFKKLEHGKFKIERKQNTCWEIASMRHALLFGVPRLTAKFDTPMTFHFLKGPRDSDSASGVLTSDTPVEIYSQYIEFYKAHGRVLVGGLGLGMAAKMIYDLPAVTSVTVIEKEADIIALIKPKLPKAIKVVHADLFKYLEELKPNKFDSAYHDIWYGTGESTWDSDVCPLYRLSRKAGIADVSAWGEHEMRGQLATGLYTRAYMEEQYSEWRPYKVFIAGVKQWFGSVPIPDGSDAKLLQLIRIYTEQVGTPLWEKIFGAARDNHKSTERA